MSRSNPAPIPPRPFPGFEPACRWTMRFLQQRFGYRLWLVTRVIRDDWIVLFTEHQIYAVEEGSILPWSETLCKRMVEGQGPRVAPNVEDFPAYRDAPLRQRWPIGAYLGIPLSNADGSLYGTLSAFDPEPQDTRALEDDSLIDLLARLLLNTLGHSLPTDARFTQAYDLSEATFDPTTGLSNTRGWEQILAAEEGREPNAARAMVVVRINCAGDTTDQTGADTRAPGLLEQVAIAITGAVRPQDAVARLGADEFAVLLPDVDGAAAAPVIARLRQALCHVSGEIRMGWAERDGATALKQTAQQALRAVRPIAEDQASTG